MQVYSMGISTVSTWFSTEKALYLLKKRRLCGKLHVGYLLHNQFSTCEAFVENGAVFVENPRKNIAFF